MVKTPPRRYIGVQYTEINQDSHQ